MPKHPNILFIMTDQQRYDCVGVNGNPIIRTPNLDALARQSANFKSFGVQAPLCMPSRQTFFTGRYPHCHRVRVNSTHRVPVTSPDTPDRLLQSFLQEHGYATACVGKLHYFPATREHALNTGFDSLLLHDETHPRYVKFSDYNRWLKQTAPEFDSCEEVLPIPGKNPYRTRIPDELHETTWCGTQSREALRRLARGEKPFFLFSSYHRPHCDFELPEPWASLYDSIEIPLPRPVSDAEIERLPLSVQKIIRRSDDRKITREQLQWMYRSYYGEISHIDREVGLTLKTLEEEGLNENTIVIFCSDHGEQLLEHGMLGKVVFFEGSVRVPMMIRYPQVIAPEAIEDLVESTDFMATLFELAGLPVPAASQGRSVAARLTNGRIGSSYTPREYIFGESVIPEVITVPPHSKWHYPYVAGQGIAGIRHPDAKMVRSHEWKYCYYVGQGEELYNLRDDPGELMNLAGESKYGEVITRMRQALLDWMITCDEREQIAPCWRES